MIIDFKSVENKPKQSDVIQLKTDTKTSIGLHLSEVNTTNSCHREFPTNEFQAIYSTVHE